MIFDCFDNVSVIHITMPDGTIQRKLANLSEHARKVLNILGLSTDIVTTVRKMPLRSNGGP